MLGHVRDRSLHASLLQAFKGLEVPMSTSTVPQKVTFLVPRTLTWDKLCALYLWVRHFFPDRIFWSFSELIRLGLADIFFDGDGERPAGAIDVDVLRDYKKSGHGSATEKVAQEQGLMNVPGVRCLVQLLDKNNRTGNLKSGEKSLVALIREFFNVGTENPSRERRIKTIDFMWPAVEAYFEACADHMADVEGLKNPFTLATFQELCDLGNVESSRTQIFLERFQQMFESAGNLREGAKERAAEIKAGEFDVPLYPGVGSVKGHLIESDNTRIASEYFKAHENGEPAVLVVRRKGGNVAIFCRGVQNFSDLYVELEAREPGRWYLETRNPSPMLLNGSTSRHAEPTKLRKDELVALIQKHYQHRTRKDQ